MRYVIAALAGLAIAANVRAYCKTSDTLDRAAQYADPDEYLKAEQTLPPGALSFLTAPGRHLAKAYVKSRSHIYQ